MRGKGHWHATTWRCSWQINKSTRRGSVTSCHYADAFQGGSPETIKDLLKKYMFKVWNKWKLTVGSGECYAVSQPFNSDWRIYSSWVQTECIWSEKGKQAMWVSSACFYSCFSRKQLVTGFWHWTEDIVCVDSAVGLEGASTAANIQHSVIINFILILVCKRKVDGTLWAVWQTNRTEADHLPYVNNFIFIINYKYYKNQIRKY